MAIIVTCPGCHKSFSVRDEFGGRKGPCPKCKTIITIPMPEQAVKVHGGEAFSDGGKSASGKLVLKPIKRRENVFNPKYAAMCAGGTLLTFLLAWILGGIFRSYGIAAYVALAVLTPVLVYAPYFFLRDTEAIEDLSPQSLKIRTLICSALYLAFWTVYIFFAPALADAFGSLFSYMTWPGAALPLVILGAIIASFLFDLEFGDGVIHTAFYVLFTGALFWAAGLSLAPSDAAQGVLSPEGAAEISAETAAVSAESESEDEKDAKKGKKDRKNRKEEAKAPAPVLMKNGMPVDPREK